MVLGLHEQGLEASKQVFINMQQQAGEEFEADQGETPLFSWYLDMRYNGQEHTVKIPVNLERQSLSEIASNFHRAHQQRYTYTLETGIEIVNFHLVAIVPVDKPSLAKKKVTGKAVDETVVQEREVDFDQHGVHNTKIYDGLAMEPGMTISGPAIIEEPSVTLVISPGHKALIDEYGNYHVHLHEGKNNE